MPERMPLNSGQIVEFLVWASLIQHSAHPVHVFLPLTDRGVDGILRRPLDDAMVALQVKGTTLLPQGPYLDIRVHEWALDDPHVRYVFALNYPDGPRLDGNVLCTDAATIRRLGHPAHLRDERLYRIETHMPPPPDSPWHGSVVRREDLTAHLLPPLPATVEVEPSPERPKSDEKQRKFEGALAEAEVMRLLSEMPDLNVFKSFPDMELTEYIARHQPTGGMRGIQVKVVALDDADAHGTFIVRDADLRFPTSALIAVLGWRRDLNAFDDEALLVPASAVKEICSRDGPNPSGHFTWVGHFHPRAHAPMRVDPFRILRTDLARHVAEGMLH